MKGRLRSVQRVLSVQTQLHRLAEWKLASLERKSESLQENQEQLLRFLGEESSYTALFGEALMRRLRSIREEKTKVAAAKKEQADQTLEELRRAGRMKHMVETLTEEARQEDERDNLRDILEQLSHRRNASLR